MSHKTREAREFIEKCLIEFAVAKPYTFGMTGGSHQEVRFVYAGRPIRYVFSNTYSDRRSLQNSRTTLRHILLRTKETCVLGRTG
jgi:hypothetical protein